MIYASQCHDMMPAICLLHSYSAVYYFKSQYFSGFPSVRFCSILSTGFIFRVKVIVLESN